MQAGIALSTCSVGILSPIGALIVAHGATNVYAGFKTGASGVHTDTVTSQFFQQVGISQNTSNLLDSCFSVGGMMWSLKATRTFALAHPSLQATKSSVKELVSPTGKVQTYTKTPRRNIFVPDLEATGSHTRFRTNPNTGQVTHYETFQYQTNPYNPKPWKRVMRLDTLGKHHYNKVLDAHIDVPHVHDPHTPGGIRPAETFEIPNFTE